tara:strand:+ start:918 stop:1463 length:546 start_codon:yes stop_codon:yes gene_type:complete
MKKLIVLTIGLLMFFFKNIATANYEKTFFDLQINDINGEIINLSDYKNKVILLVNTASYCGFTKQYDDLQKLWDDYKESGLVIIGVPSNSFNQEKKSNNEVKKFCEVNFSIDFPITTIVDVKGENAHDIYKWAKKNYGKSAIPKWNFYKILINKQGKIEDTFNSFTKPLSKKIINRIEKIL